MKLKIEDIAKEYASLKKAQKDRAAQIVELENKISALNDKARESAISGNMETFKQIKQDIEFLSYQLEALKTQQENESVALPLEKVQSAWNEYEAHREKRNRELQKNLEDVRDQLLKVMIEIAKHENEGLKIRNDCAKYVGMSPALHKISDGVCLQDISATFPMKYFDLGYYPFNNIMEFNYLDSVGKIARDYNQKQNRLDVLSFHYPSELEF